MKAILLSIMILLLVLSACDEQGQTGQLDDTVKDKEGTTDTLPETLTPPEPQEIIIDFTEEFSEGEAYQVQLIGEELALDTIDETTYHRDGYWISPAYDTGEEYVLWEWVRAEADFQGLQENLLHDGDFETQDCQQYINGETWPKPCGFYFERATGPLVDDRYSTSGDYSLRFFFDDKNVEENAGGIRPSSGNAETSYWYEFDSSKDLHTVFDLKYDNDGSKLEFWYIFGIAPNWTNVGYNGAAHQIYTTHEDFEEYYFVNHASQFVSNAEDMNYAAFRFFEYYSNDDYDNTAWIDDMWVFQDSPISYQTRSSADGVTWTDWSDERYFVASKTSPGSMPNRYIQFKINIKTDDGTKTPLLSDIELDYSKAFEFKIGWEYQGESVIDPEIEVAGTRGYARPSSDGNLYFEDGTQAKFWAVQNNGYDNAWSDFTHEDMDSMCKKLSQMGFNMIKTDMSNTYTDVLWEGFDYMLASCKEQGIYFYIQLNGPKYCSHTIEKIMPHQRDCFETHIDGFMNHVNEYTGIAYKDEPQIAMVQLLNERSMHSRWLSNHAVLRTDGASGFKTELYELWHEYLLEKYPTLSQLQDAWNDGTGTAFTDEEEAELEDNYPQALTIIHFYDNWDSFSKKRFADTTDFFAQIHSDFYDDMEAYVRDEVGTQTLIIDNNHYYCLAELATRQGSDVIDQHSYYGHPRTPSQWGEIMTQIPQSQNPHHNMIDYIALDDIKGYPMSVSESNHHYPSLYSVEMPLFVTAYMSYQDWDQWTYFKFVPVNWIKSDSAWPKVPEPLNSVFDPGRMAFMPAASKIFTEGYISPGQSFIELSHTEETTNDAVLTSRVQRVNFAAEKDAAVRTGVPSLQPKGNVYVSDTTELRLDSEQGMLSMDSDKVQGFSGFTPDEPISLTYLDIDIFAKGNEFSSILLVPLDDKEIEKSEHLLLTAAGRTQSSTVAWTADKRAYTGQEHHWNIARYGEEPVLVEGIIADLVLKVPEAEATIYQLDATGNRKDKKELLEWKEGFRFDISDQDETLWYEIVIGRPNLSPDDDQAGKSTTDESDTGSGEDSGSIGTR